MLMSKTLYSIVWIGRFNPKGEKLNSTKLTCNTIFGKLLWHFNWEPLLPVGRETAKFEKYNTEMMTYLISVLLYEVPQ
jgi:hypothetical protein